MEYGLVNIDSNFYLRNTQNQFFTTGSSGILRLCGPNNMASENHDDPAKSDLYNSESIDILANNSVSLYNNGVNPLFMIFSNDVAARAALNCLQVKSKIFDTPLQIPEELQKTYLD